MSKTIICGIAALCAAHTAHAQDQFYQPKYEAEVFYSNIIIEDSFLQDEGAPNPKGDGGGIRLQALLNDTVQATVEGSFSAPDIKADDGTFNIQYTQIRTGLRATAKAKNGSPVYAAAALEYGHFIFDGQLNFDPAAGFNDVDFDAAKIDLGIGHIKTGYRTESAHIYLDGAYGVGSDYTLMEYMAGASFRVVKNISLFGEYRGSVFKNEGDKTKFKDLRAGIGASF